MKLTLLTGRLTRSTHGAVGYDLHSTHDQIVPVGGMALIRTGVRTVMDGCWALILDRSGLAARWGISRRAGVIDPDYRDEWTVVLRNEGPEGYIVRTGDRIAQAVLLPLFEVEVVGLEMSLQFRVGGLGSTGT